MAGAPEAVRWLRDQVLGKPSAEFFTAPLEALGRGTQSALVVGDDLAADIGGGKAVGAATVLVRSGKGDRPQPGADAEPDMVVDSVADLPGLLRGPGSASLSR